MLAWIATFINEVERIVFEEFLVTVVKTIYKQIVLFCKILIVTLDGLLQPIKNQVVRVRL